MESVSPEMTHEIVRVDLCNDYNTALTITSSRKISCMRSERISFSVSGW